MRGFIHPKKKIQIGLLVLLLMFSFLLLFNNKFKALVTSPLINSQKITGNVLSEENKQPVSGVEAVFSPIPPYQNDPSKIYTATTDAEGRYGLLVPSAITQGNLTFTKDGFYDLEGIADVPPNKPTLRTINLTMKPGFGKETFISKKLKNGFNQLSLPFTPYGKLPQEVFTDLDIQGSSATPASSPSNTPEFIQGKEFLNTQLAYKLGDCSAGGATVVAQPSGASKNPQTGAGGNDICPAIEPTYTYPNLPTGWIYTDDRQNLDGDVDVAYSGAGGNATGACSLATNPSCTFSNLTASRIGTWIYDHIPIWENNPNIKFYYLNAQGVPELYDPRNPNNFLSYPKEIKAGTGYYFQNSGEDYQITFKGMANYQDYELALNQANLNTAIGNPYLEDVSSYDLIVKDVNNTYTLNEAIEKNYIDKNLLTRTGINPEDISGDQIDLTQTPYIFNPADTAFLKVKVSSLKLKFTPPNARENIEIPANISLEDAEWVFWINRETLDESEKSIWNNISGALSTTALSKINESLSENIDPSQVQFEPGNLDAQLTFTKNGKKIPRIPPDSDNLNLNIPHDTFQDQNINEVAGDTDVTVPPEARFQNSEGTFVLAAEYLDTVKIDGNKTACIPWTPDQYRWFHSTVEQAYEKVVDYYGLPNTSFEFDRLWRRTNLNYHFVMLCDIGDLLGLTDNYNDIIYLNSKMFVGKNLDNEKCDKCGIILLHEIIHAFESPKGTADYDDNYFHSWSEGMAYLVSDMVGKDLGLYDDMIFRYITSPREHNQPFLFNNNKYSINNSAKFLGRWGGAAASMNELYAWDNQIFKKYTKAVYQGSNPYKAMKDALKGKVGIKEVKNGNQLIAQSFDEWYEKQWLGLIQIGGENKYSRRFQIYSMAKLPFSRSGSGILERVVLPWINDRNGNMSYSSYKISSYISKVATISGKETTLPVDAIENVNVSDDVSFYHTLTFAQGTGTKQKFTYQNIIKPFRGSSAANRRKYPSNVYTAVHGDNAGIYGVVSQESSGTKISITPLLPIIRTSRNFDVANGYFQTSNDSEDAKNYGWNAGTYYLTYTPKCGTKREYYITKTDGIHFLAIKGGKAFTPALPPQVKNNLLEKFSAAIHLSSKVQADFGDTCYMGGLELKDISETSMPDGSQKISFSTTRPAYSIVEWGESSEYGQERVNFTEAKKQHEVTLSPLALGSTYHYNIFVEDADGRTEDEGSLATNPEEEDSEIIDSAESGDQTLIPIEIKNVQEKDIIENQATITWETVPDTKGLIEYGKTSEFGNISEETLLGTNHSVTLKDLIPGTLYFYRIKAFTDEKNTAYFDQLLTFRTTNEPLTISFYEGNSNYLNWWKTPTSFRSQWVTNKPAACNFTYRPSSLSGPELNATTPSSTIHMLKLETLLPGREYTANINCTETGTLRTAAFGPFWPRTGDQQLQINFDSNTYAPNILISWQSNGPWPDNYPNPTETQGNPANYVSDGQLKYSSFTLDFPGPNNPTNLLLTGLTSGSSYPLKIYGDKFPGSISAFSGTLYPKNPQGYSSTNEISIPLISSGGITVNSTVTTETTPIILDWNQIKEKNIDGYHVYRAENEKEDVLVASIRSDQTTYKDKDVKANNQYHYKIKSYKNNQDIKEITKATVSVQKLQNQTFFQKLFSKIKNIYIAPMDWITNLLRHFASSII